MRHAKIVFIWGAVAIYFIGMVVRSATNCAVGNKTVTLQIKTPAKDRKVHLESINHLYLENSFLAANSGQDNDKLRWKVGNLKFSPADGYKGIGLRIKGVGISAWPSTPTDTFGKIDVELSYEGSTEGCKDTVPVKIFFPMRQIISGSTRAWLAYWPEMGATDSILGEFTPSVDGGISQEHPAGVYPSCTVEVNADNTLKVTPYYSCYIHPEAIDSSAPSGSTELEKIGSILAHEIEHMNYYEEVCIPYALEQWELLSEEERNTMLNSPSKDYIEFIWGIADDKRSDSANETQARAQNGNFPAFIDASKDWSIGGPNDQ